MIDGSTQAKQTWADQSQSSSKRAGESSQLHKQHALACQAPPMKSGWQRCRMQKGLTRVNEIDLMALMMLQRAEDSMTDVSDLDRPCQATHHNARQDQHNPHRYDWPAVALDLEEDLPLMEPACGHSPKTGIQSCKGISGSFFGQEGNAHQGLQEDTPQVVLHLAPEDPWQHLR